MELLTPVLLLLTLELMALVESLTLLTLLLMMMVLEESLTLLTLLTLRRGRGLRCCHVSLRRDGRSVTFPVGGRQEFKEPSCPVTQ